MGETGWELAAVSAGVTSLAPIGSSPNANAATLTGTVLNLEPASASFGGVVTTGAQTFAGAKTFSGTVTLTLAPVFTDGPGSRTAIGLGSVTNDAQTKAAIVPNTAPSAGQIPVGNAGGTAYAPQTMSGNATLSSTGAMTIGAAQVTNAMHANMAAHTVKANITGSSAAPVDSSLSAILDAELGSTRGMILRREASTWAALALGSSGQAVVSDGTDAKWGSVGAGSGGGYVKLGATTVAGSAATVITVSGLDLSLYKAFKVYFALKDAAGTGTGTISLYYNSDTTAGDYQEQGLTLSNATSTPARATDAKLGNLDSGRYLTGFIEIEMDILGRASALIFANRDNSAGVVWQSSMHTWITNYANVTGITLSSSIANQLAIGSTFIVYGITA